MNQFKTFCFCHSNFGNDQKTNAVVVHLQAIFCEFYHLMQEDGYLVNVQEFIKQWDVLSQFNLSSLVSMNINFIRLALQSQD